MRIFILFIFLLLPLGVSSQELYFPPLSGDEWDIRSAESLNWCNKKIDSLYNFLESEKTYSFILLKDGKIVLEKYFDDHTRDSLWVWFSAGKSLRALLFGIAQEEGYLDIHDKTSEYLGEGWTSLEKDKEDMITIWHQLTMTTGLNELLFFCTDPDCLHYKSDAGSRWVYHNSPYSLLKDVLEEATATDINSYTAAKVKNKIGMGTVFWYPSGYNNFFISNTRDMARFGLLIQAGGIWNGTPVINDGEYFNQMINTSQELNLSYGYLWWLNGKASHIAPGSTNVIEGPIAPDAPFDAITAAGAQGQFISISRDKGLVMIRQGLSPNEDENTFALHNEIWKRIIELECPTSVKETFLPHILTTYPNPTAGSLNVSFTLESPVANARIQICNYVGEVLAILHEGALSSGEHNFECDMSIYPGGIYFYTLNINGKSLFQTVNLVR